MKHLVYFVFLWWPMEKVGGIWGDCRVVDAKLRFTQNVCPRNGELKSRLPYVGKKKDNQTSEYVSLFILFDNARHFLFQESLFGKRSMMIGMIMISGSLNRLQQSGKKKVLNNVNSNFIFNKTRLSN